MKILILLLISAFSFSAFSQTAPEISALLTITNAGKITNAQSTFSVNGTARTWTNLTGFSPTTTIAFTNDGFQATTNLLRAYQAYRATGAGGPVFARTNATNILKFTATPGDALAITFTPGYCSVTYSTNYYTNSFPLNQPFTSEPNQQKTNMMSAVVDSLTKYPTNGISETAKAMSNFVSLSQVQHFGNKYETNCIIEDSYLGFSGHSNILGPLKLYWNELPENDQGVWLFNSGGTLQSRVTSSTNGYLGEVYAASGLPLSIYAELGYIPDEALLTYRTARDVFPALAPIAGGISQDTWTIPNLWLTATNRFGSPLWIYGDLRVMGGTVIISNATLQATQAWMVNAFLTNSAMTNVAGAFSGLTATNLQSYGGTLSNQLVLNTTGSNIVLKGSNVANAIFYPQFNLDTLANGNNISVPAGTNEYIRIAPGALTGAPTICGIVGAPTLGGAPGQRIWWLNDSTYNVVFAQNTVDPVPSNRILTDSGSDLTVPYKGWICLYYDTANSRWRVADLYPSTASATNAVIAGINFMATNATSFDVFGFTSNSSVMYFYGLEQGTNAVLYRNGSNIVINAALPVGSGEANVNGEVSITNATRFGLVNGKASVTNLLRSLSPGNGLTGTNQGTNISLAIDPAIVASQANLTAVSNQFVLIQSGTANSLIATNPTLIGAIARAATGATTPAFAVGNTNLSSTNLYVGTNGNVGINTNAPAVELTVQGSGQFSGGLTNTGGANFGGGSLTVQASGGATTASGNLLGNQSAFITTALTSLTFTAKSVRVNAQTNAPLTGSALNPQSWLDTNGNVFVQMNSNAVIIIGTNANGFTIISNCANVTNFSIQMAANPPSFYIGPGGNVGIQTNGSLNALDVNGIIHSCALAGEVRVNQAGNYISLIVTNSKAGLYRSGAGSFFYYDTSAGNTVMDMVFPGAADIFSISGTEKMRISNAGNLGIGTASPLASLHVTNSQAATDPLRVYTQTGNGALAALLVNSNRLVQVGASAATNTPPAGYAGFFAETNSGTIEMAVIDSAGNVTQISPHPRDCPAIFLITTNWASGWPEVNKSVKLFAGTVTWKNATLETLISKWSAENLLIGSNYLGTLPLIVRTNLTRALYREETFAAYNARLGLAPGAGGLIQNNWAAVQTQRQSDYNLARTNELMAFNTPLIVPDLTNADLTITIGYTNAVNTNITVRPIADITEPKPPLVDYVAP